MKKIYNTKISKSLPLPRERAGERGLMALLILLATITFPLRGLGNCTSGSSLTSLSSSASPSPLASSALSLNGEWNAIVDLYDQGERMKVFENREARKPEEFFEYAFAGGLRLHVPGDWNSQRTELKYYEGTVWYARHFDKPVVDGLNRHFLSFGAVSYRCQVYLNGQKVGQHEGGFTPFQIEVTGKLKEKDNLLVVEVNNRRTVDAIPALAFDWWNYGGITRDVKLVSMPATYIADYFVHLAADGSNRIEARVQLSEAVAGQPVNVEVAELGKILKLVTNANGVAEGSMKVEKLQRWSTKNPKLYEVVVTSPLHKVSDHIGFRHISTRGTEVLLNGEPLFLCSVSFHEEIPQRMGRATNEADAAMLLNEVKALGCNMVRLAHYPQNEYTVRMAEKMGILLWQEIPVWQAIDFEDETTKQKSQTMFREMLCRDKNRCAVCFWGVANETKPSEARNAFLGELLEFGRSLDKTRLYVAAFDLVYFNEERQCFAMDDPFAEKLDVVAINKYMGWYHPWPLDPQDCVWDVCPGKPLFISEFGGEALYGQTGSDQWASSWSEEYQEKLYRDNLRMFQNIPNLCGVSPWVLFDFRSPFRFHPTNQEGWNRKGLLSNRGERKKAWYLMRDFYKSKNKDL